jgi:hypothetical protein
VNFPFTCNNIPTAPVSGVYISFHTIFQRVAANKKVTGPKDPSS